MASNLKPKFLRALYAGDTNTANETASLQYMMRVIYEFWGFCINGTNDLRNPGGFSTSHTTGSYISCSVGFESGSTVLLASGSDGETVSNMPYFNAASAPFSQSYVGKFLTMWQSGSTSTDDSIYRIVGWVNSSSIVVDPTYGGTSIGPTGSVAQLTTRSSINWRIVDYYAAAHLSTRPVQGFMVLQFNGAADVNPGQRNSQVKLTWLNSSSPNNNWTAIRMRLSPSGSWDGTQFVGSFENSSDIVHESGYGSGGWAFEEFLHNATLGGTGFITIAADKTFFIFQTTGTWLTTFSTGYVSAIFLEIPKRLYPQENDPNPICGISFGAFAVQTIAGQGFGWGGRFIPSPYDTTLRRYQATIPCYTGGWWQPDIHTNYAPQLLNSARNPLYYNPVNQRYLLQHPIMSLGHFVHQAQEGKPSVSGKTAYARVRLRSVLFAPMTFRLHERIDDGNEKWIHVGAGVLYPWDNAIVPGNPQSRKPFINISHAI